MLLFDYTANKVKIIVLLKLLFLLVWEERSRGGEGGEEYGRRGEEGRRREVEERMRGRGGEEERKRGEIMRGG